MKSIRTLAIATTAVAATIASAGAGTTIPSVSDPEPIATAGGWSFQFVPYAWLVANTGDMSVGPVSSDIDISIKDTLDSVDMVFMATAAASYERWTFGLDFVYGRLSQDGPGRTPAVSNLGPRLKQYLYTPVVSYRAVENEQMKLDVLAGARITSVDATMNVTSFRGVTRSIGADETFVDPLIGFKGTTAINEKWDIMYGGTIGGFGVNSDLIWDAMLGFGYHFNDSITGIAGYRGLGMDYSEGPLSVDIVTHGPILGVSFTF